MARKKRKINRFGPISPEEILKYEIAEELGLMPRVTARGWAGLTAEETGRIGGILRVRLQKRS